MNAYSARSVAAFCQASPGILSSIDRLPCTTSSWEYGRMKFSVNAYSIEKVISFCAHRRCTGSRAVNFSVSCIHPMFHL